MDKMQIIKPSMLEGRSMPGCGFPVAAGFSRLCRNVSLAAGACLLSTLLLLAGCSKEQASEPGGDRVEIVPQAGLPVPKVGTKSVADPSQEMKFWFVRSDESAAGMWGDYGASALGASRTGGAGEQALKFDAKQYYLTNGLNTRMVGWYPGGATEAKSGDGFYDASTGTVGWTIDGGQDILLAAPREGSKTAAMPVFEFKHALAQLQFHFYADDEKAASQWGKILGVAVRGQRSAAAFVPAEAADDNLGVTFTGDATETFASANFAALTAPVGTKDDAAAGGDPVMIEPKSFRLTFDITTEKQGVQTAFVESRVYRVGAAVRIYVRLSDLSVRIDPEACEIVPWSSVVQTDVIDIDGEGHTYPRVLNGNTVLMKDNFGTADGYPIREEAWTVTPVHSASSATDNKSGYNTVAKKFRVASSNAIDINREEINHPYLINWYMAAGITDATYNSGGYSACAEYSEEADQSDKGLWRLPTIRELLLMRALHSELTAVTEFEKYPYWSATKQQYDDKYIWEWSNYQYSGEIKTGPGRSDNYVRCV